MKFADFREKNEKELQDMLKEQSDMLRAMNFKVHDAQLKEVRKIRQTRKTIAKILTALNQKQS